MKTDNSDKYTIPGHQLEKIVGMRQEGIIKMPGIVFHKQWAYRGVGHRRKMFFTNDSIRVCTVYQERMNFLYGVLSEKSKDSRLSKIANIEKLDLALGRLPEKSLKYISGKLNLSENFLELLEA